MYSFDFVNHLFEEIEKIKKRKDFPAVLVGTQSDQEENRRITYKEGLSGKENSKNIQRKLWI